MQKVQPQEHETVAKAFQHPKRDCRSTGLQLPTKQNLKNTEFINTIILRFLHKFRFSQNQQLRSDEDWYSGVWKIIMKA
jgi:hypothetical protein